ncbi:TIGR02808 family protein, partial [Vibrio parahaemolyticus]|nr:TIGR02808 family protein [Vibrio parahaemolyticus]
MSTLESVVWHVGDYSSMEVLILGGDG